jgi:hypothetical protein
MEKYCYRITLEVEVDAFDESDAWDAVQDEFGTGEQMGVNITKCEYREIKAKKK